MLLAFLFFVAFTSYLFTWGEDQDKFSYRMLLANDIKVQNLLGTFGAFISEIFIRHGFGIASYLICTTFFVFGINLFFGKKERIVREVWQKYFYQYRTGSTSRKQSKPF